MSPQPAPHDPIAFRVLKGAVSNHMADSGEVDLIRSRDYVVVLFVNRVLGIFGDGSMFIEITLSFPINAADSSGVGQSPKIPSGRREEVIFRV